MTDKFPTKDSPRRQARGRRTRILVPVALLLAMLTSGCDKCGDYFWERGAKSCHDESQVK